MNTDVIKQINIEIKKYLHFEFNIFSYSNGKLMLVGSEDIVYYHNMEICFSGVFAIISNFQWRVDCKKEPLSVLNGVEAVELNKYYKVEVGNSIFKFENEDEINIYIIAESIEFNNNIVKYSF